MFGPDFRWRAPRGKQDPFGHESETYFCKRSNRGFNYRYKDWASL